MVPKSRAVDIHYVDRMLASSSEGGPAAADPCPRDPRDRARRRERRRDRRRKPADAGDELRAGDLAASRRMKTTRVGAATRATWCSADPDGDRRRARRAQQDLWHYSIARMVGRLRATGILPFYGPFGDITDIDGCEAQFRAAFLMGCVGSWSLHPRQIDVPRRSSALTPKKLPSPRGHRGDPRRPRRPHDRRQDGRTTQPGRRPVMVQLGRDAGQEGPRARLPTVLMRRGVALAFAGVALGGCPAAAATESVTRSSGAVTATLPTTRARPASATRRLRTSVCRSRSPPADALNGPVVSSFCSPQCEIDVYAHDGSLQSRTSSATASRRRPSPVHRRSHCCSIVQVYEYDPGTQPTADSSTTSRTPATPGRRRRQPARSSFKSADARFAYQFTFVANSGCPIQIWRFAGAGSPTSRSAFPRRLALTPSLVRLVHAQPPRPAWALGFVRRLDATSISSGTPDRHAGSTATPAARHPYAGRLNPGGRASFRVYTFLRRDGYIQGQDPGFIGFSPGYCVLEYESRNRQAGRNPDPPIPAFRHHTRGGRGGARDIAGPASSKSPGPDLADA